MSYTPPIVDISATGTLTALNQTVEITTLNGHSNVGILVNPTSLVGTLIFEGSIDGTNYQNIKAVLVGSTTESLTIVNPTINAYLSQCSGFTKFRVRVSAFTSGSVIVNLLASAGVRTDPNQVDIGSISATQAALQSTQPVGTEIGVVVRNVPVGDQFITGQSGQTVSGNNIILATAGSTSTDTINGSSTASYRSVYFQFVPTGTVSSGVISFEGSHDNTTFVALPMYDAASLTANPVTTISPATGVSRYMEGKTRYRYIRARISTVIGGGGSMQCFTRLSGEDYIPSIITIAQATAANLNVTAALAATQTLTTVTTVGTVTTLANGQTAHSSASTGSPVRIGGRVAETTAATQDQTLVAGDAADLKMTTGGQIIQKPYGGADTDWTFACTAAIANTTDVVLKAASGTAGIRTYITGIQIINSSATVATEVVIKDNATVIWRGYVGIGTALNSVVGVTFPTPLRGTANVAMNFACITTGSSVYINAQGYTGV